MKLHYAHQNPDVFKPIHMGHSFKRGTLAIELPTKEHLESCVKQHATCTLINAGFTRVHPKEQFNKRLGRFNATQHIQPSLTYFTNIEFKNTSLVYNLIMIVPSNVPGQKIEEIKLGLATVAETNHVKLLYMYVD